MKTLLFCMFISATGCNAMLSHAPTLPEGATPCRTDYDCKPHYACGFADVDQYASCMYRGQDYSHFN